MWATSKDIWQFITGHTGGIEWSKSKLYLVLNGKTINFCEEDSFVFYCNSETLNGPSR